NSQRYWVVAVGVPKESSWKRASKVVKGAAGSWQKSGVIVLFARSVTLIRAVIEGEIVITRSTTDSQFPAALLSRTLRRTSFCPDVLYANVGLVCVLVASGDPLPVLLL